MSEPKKILLVEDEDNDVFFITRAFEKASILNPITRVKDGEEALAYLFRDPPFSNHDSHSMPLLILLDMRMPKVSGLEVIVKVRQTEHLSHVSLVVLTFTTDSPDLDAALKAGANGWLLKPVTTNGILEMLGSTGLGLHITKPACIQPKAEMR